MSSDESLAGVAHPVGVQSQSQSFSLFPCLPAEIRTQIWSEYMRMYEDNAAVVWKLVWGIDDRQPEVKSKSRGEGQAKFQEKRENKHIRIRPYISFGSDSDPSQIMYLVEYQCCPLLRVNHEARQQALRGNRYAIVPVMGWDINVIVKPLDIFFSDEESLFRLVHNWQNRYGPLVSITLAEDMGFAQRILMSERDVITKMCHQGNYTLSATPPDLHVITCSQERWKFSLITIAQTYLRNAHTIFVETSWNIGWFTSGRFSGTHFLPHWYHCYASLDPVSLNGCGSSQLRVICQKLITNPSYHTNPASWSLVSQLHHTLSTGNPWATQEIRLGQLSYTNGVFQPNSGPNIYLINCSYDAILRETTPCHDISGLWRNCLPQSFSRIVKPIRRFSSYIPRPTFLISRKASPTTLPLRQGRLLKVVAQGDANFFRERHCYTPILPVQSLPTADLAAGRDNLAPGSADSGSTDRGCPRCYKKQWLITGHKPDYVPFCRENTCWTSYYTYADRDWKLFGVKDRTLHMNEDLTDRGPQVMNNTEDGYNSDNDDRVILRGRTEGLRKWWKSLDGYMEDEELIDKIVTNKIVASELKGNIGWLGQGVLKKGWSRRPKLKAEGNDGEERLMFWDDLVERDPGKSAKEIQEMEREIQQAR